MPSGRSGTKFTAATRARIIEGIEIGLPRWMAAARAGIVKSTFYAWLERGAKQPDGAYGRFAADIEAAEARNAERILGHWNDAVNDDWRAGEALLSRRHPDDFGKRERVEVAGPAGEPIRVVIQWPDTAPPE